MEPTDLLCTVPEQTAAAAAAGGAIGLDAHVPSCPGWDVRSVFGHLGAVHRWATHLIGTGSMELGRPSGDRPTDDEIVPWLRRGASELVAVGQAKGPDAPVGNWTDAPPNAAFWFRRMAHETAVHCWDVRSAGGDPTPIPAGLASDGIDELLSVVLPRRKPEGLAGTLHVHCTDVPGEWTVDLATFITRPEHTKADAAIRGAASDLLLRLLNRTEGGEAFGDARILSQWASSVRF